ncbi:MAG: tail fiber domain-containing protein, partial [Thermoplasmata archaeon]
WNAHLKIHQNFAQIVTGKVPFFSEKPLLDLSIITYQNEKLFINTQNAQGLLNTNSINASNIFLNGSSLFSYINATSPLTYQNHLSLSFTDDFTLISDVLTLKQSNPSTVAKQTNKLYVYDIDENGLIKTEQAIEFSPTITKNVSLIKAKPPGDAYISETFKNTNSKLSVFPTTKTISGIKLTVTSPVTLTEHQVFFEIDFSVLPEVNQSYSNLRVYDTSSKKYIPFWVEETNPKRIWIKTNLVANQPSSFIVFVDNTQISMNNPYSVFEFFDDFLDDTPDLTLYLEANTQQGQIFSDLANSKLRISSTGDFWGTSDTAKHLIINKNFNFDLEAVAKIDSASFTAYQRFFGARTSSSTNSRLVVLLVNNTTEKISLVYRTSDGGNATYLGDSTNISTPSPPFLVRIIKTGTKYYFAINNTFLGSPPVEVDLGTNTSYIFLGSSHNLSKFVSFDYIYVKKYSKQENNFIKSSTIVTDYPIEISPVVAIFTNDFNNDSVLCTKTPTGFYPTNSVVSDFTFVPWNLIESGLISSDLSNVSAKTQNAYLPEKVYVRGFARKTPMIYFPLNTSGENRIVIKQSAPFVKSSQSVSIYDFNTNPGFTVINPANVTQQFQNSHWIVSTGTSNLDWWGGVSNNTVRLLIPQPINSKQIETKISYYNLVNYIHLGFAVSWNDQNAYLFGIMYDSSRQGVYLDRILNNSGTSSVDYVYFTLPQTIFLKVELSTSSSNQKHILFSYSTDGYVWTYLKPQPYLLSDEPNVYLMVKKWGTSTSTTVAFDYIKIYDGVASFALSSKNYDPILISKNLGTNLSETYNISFSGTITSKHLSIISDIITKTNITPLKTQSLNMTPIKYFDTIDEKTKYGFIAQEIEYQNKELVKEDNNLKTISYIQIIPIIISKIKKMYGDKYGLVQQ